MLFQSFLLQGLIGEEGIQIFCFHDQSFNWGFWRTYLCQILDLRSMGWSNQFSFWNQVFQSCSIKLRSHSNGEASFSSTLWTRLGNKAAHFQVGSRRAREDSVMGARGVSGKARCFPKFSSDENKAVETTEITSFRTHKKSVLRILTWTKRRKRVRSFRKKWFDTHENRISKSWRSARTCRFLQ